VDPDGTRTVVDWRDVWGSDELPLALHRRSLASLLLSALRPGTVRWSVAPQQLVQDDDGVQVRFTDGDSRTYRLVVGADGINSWVRRIVDSAATPRYTGHTFIRTTTPASEATPATEWRTWRAKPYIFGLMPIGAGRTAVFLQVAGAEPVRLEPAEALEVLHAAADDMPSTVRTLVAGLRLDEPLVTRPAFALSTSRVAAGRVVLVGDAAHAVSPATTQGGGLAVEDAAVLGAEIAAHGCDPAALAAFEERRTPRLVAFHRAASRHATLMDAVQRLPRPSEPVRAVSTVDASRWYQRLYTPLLTAP